MELRSFQTFFMFVSVVISNEPFPEIQREKYCANENP